MSLKLFSLRFLACLLALTAVAWVQGDDQPVVASRDVNTVALIDLEGKIQHLGERDQGRPLAIVFLSPECPISNQYAVELNRIHGSVKDRCDFYGVVFDPTISRQRAVDFAKEYKLAFPVLFDSSSILAGMLKPARIPEAFVVKLGGEVAYRGRIDDQYAAVGRRRPAVSQHDLLDAINAVAAGKAPAAAVTEVVGCPVESPRSEDKITYARHVASILNARCVACHRAGEVAPFSLTSYQEASKRADFIHEMTSSRRMPPWHARPDYGHFQGVRRLTDREIEVLSAWAKTGAPEGDSSELPPEPQFAEGWQLGEPDLVLKMTEPFTVPASGPDIFRFFVMPIDLPEDKIVAAVEFRPGNRRVAHHSIMFLDSTGIARERDAADPQPGYEGGFTGGFQPSGTLGFWAPGYTPRFLPDGVGQKLAQGTDLAMQMHYHPSGKEESDQSQVGIYFADKPVEKYLSTFAMISLDVNIMPRVKRHRIAMTFTTPVDLDLLDVTPHMHMIGTEMKARAILPDGKELPLVWSDWNFNWQEQYQYASPVRLPKGTRIDLEGFYDNTADNPYNPNSPPKRVGLGEMTTDEMCIMAFHTISDPAAKDQHLLQQAIGESFQEQLKNPRVMMAIASLVGREGDRDNGGLFAMMTRRFRGRPGGKSNKSEANPATQTAENKSAENKDEKPAPDASAGS